MKIKTGNVGNQLPTWPKCDKKPGKGSVGNMGTPKVSSNISKGSKKR